MRLVFFVKANTTLKSHILYLFQAKEARQSWWCLRPFKANAGPIRGTGRSCSSAYDWIRWCPVGASYSTFHVRWSRATKQSEKVREHF